MLYINSYYAFIFRCLGEVVVDENTETCVNIDQDGILPIIFSNSDMLQSTVKKQVKRIKAEHQTSICELGI